MGMRKLSYCLFIIAVIFSLSGCALLKLPFDLLGSAFKLATQAAAFADSLPKPPAWAFL